MFTWSDKVAATGEETVFSLGNKKRESSVQFLNETELNLFLNETELKLTFLMKLN
jgi:hypothetical protein